MTKHYFYIARCLDGSLYVGSTNYIPSRVSRHNMGHGSLWIKQHGRAQIVYTEDYPSYLDARRREIQVKKWSRLKKENLISGKWSKQ